MLTSSTRGARGLNEPDYMLSTFSFMLQGIVSEHRRKRGEGKRRGRKGKGKKGRKKKQNKIKIMNVNVFKPTVYL